MFICRRLLQTGLLATLPLAVLLTGCASAPGPHASDTGPETGSGVAAATDAAPPPAGGRATGPAPRGLSSSPPPVVSAPMAPLPRGDGPAAGPRGYAGIPGSVMVPAGGASRPAPATPVRAPVPMPVADTGTPSQPLSVGAPVAPAGILQRYAADVAAGRSLDAAAVLALLQDARYDATVARLIAPARSGRIRRSWTTYRQRFVEPVRLRHGRAFMAEHGKALARAEQQYGVPAPIIAAIIGVETVYGRNTGNFRVLDALATLAFQYPDPTRPDRAKLFNDQLADFLELSLANGLDGRRALGSYAGAIGLPQFMPGSIRRYAVDGDGDGRIDLGASVPDAVMSVANFLVEHGWRPGLPVFAPVALPPDPSALVDGGLAPTLDWPELATAGARSLAGPPAGAWQEEKLGVIDLADESAGRVQYRTATPNFFALTQYNRSYFYATAVSDLAEALARR